MELLLLRYISLLLLLLLLLLFKLHLLLLLLHTGMCIHWLDTNRENFSKLLLLLLLQ